MKLNDKNTERGFTLMEAILYLAIAGIVIYFVSGFAFNSIFGKSRIEVIQGVNNSGQAVLEDMSSTIGDAIQLNGITQ